MTIAGLITLMLFDFIIIDKGGKRISKALFCAKYPELARRIVSVFNEADTDNKYNQNQYVITVMRPCFVLLGFDLIPKHIYQSTTEEKSDTYRM